MKISKVKARNLYSANVAKPNGGYKKVYGKTKKEVREKAESLALDIRSGKFVEDSKITVYEWLDQWVEHYLLNVSDNTILTYKSIIKNRIKVYLDDKGLQKLTHNDVQKFITTINQKYAPKSVKCTHLVLHRALKDAVLNGFIPVNPADNIILPKVPKNEISPLDREEIAEFIDTAYKEEPFYADIFEFMLLTGLRVGEITGLTFDNYYPETKSIIVKQQYLRKVKKFAPPKHNVVREIVLSERAIKIIENRSKNNIPTFNPNNLIFTSVNFKILNDGTLRQAFSRIKEKINKPNLRLHDLRHTFATATLDAGTDIKTLQKLLGHSDATFTMNKYAHSSRLMQEDAAKRMDVYFENLTQN